jgi:branched-chain amino acid aminotransferase
MTFKSAQPVTHSDNDRLAKILADPGFVNFFSDHMAQAEWSLEKGWHDPGLVDYQPWSLAPGTAVFHYAQEIFEGLKVYRHADDSLWLFRPEMNAQRFQRSAQRMCLPVLPEDDFLAAVRALAQVDAAWVPKGAEMSYYMRPFLFADEAFLGVHAANKARFAVVGGPAAPYIADGLTPADIWVTTTYSRAGNGGTGAAKCGGNYASSLFAQAEGADHGCSQVLFTDASSHLWVEELGGMNFFLVTSDDHLVTPPTSGTILDGITRDSILTLAPALGLTPQVRPIALAELLDGIADGSVREAFACGTAAVVTPIGCLVHRHDGEIMRSALPQSLGDATRAIRRQLVDVQWGRAEDSYGWLQPVTSN